MMPLLCFLLIVSGALGGIGVNKEIPALTIVGVVIFFFSLAMALMISSSSSQSLHGVCATINSRLSGCVEVAQHVVGNNSRIDYLKIDVSRLKELKRGYEPPQEVKPPAYDFAAKTVEPSAPSKQTEKAASKQTGSRLGHTVAWTR